MTVKNVKISNFKLSTFKNLMEQSLMVDNQLMFNFNSEMIKACSFSSTRTFIKLWNIPLKNLIIIPDQITSVDDVILPAKKETIVESFEEFDFYILRGDLFKKFLSVYNDDSIDLEFTLMEINGKLRGTSIILTGYGSSNTLLKTTFTLTSEDMISNKIDDYGSIIKECTPTKGAFEFILSSKQIQEIKRLIKNLHKSIPNNSAFLSFNIDVDNNKIVVNDKVFVLDITVDPELQKEIKFPNKSFTFNILKSDFVITGNHDYTFYVLDEEKKVILGARYAGAIVWGLCTKIEETAMQLDDASMDATIDNLDISEYL